MDQVMVQRYLQDIIDLETRMKIAANTYNRLTLVEESQRLTLKSEAVKTSISWGKIWKKIIIIGYLLAVVSAGIVFQLLGEPNDTQEILLALGAVAVLGILAAFFIGNAKMEQNQKYCEDVIEMKKRKEQAGAVLAQVQFSKSQLKETYKKCQLNLQKLYELNVITPKYRELVPCAMFLEYLSTGRTHSLEAVQGDMGAYNLYEDELYKKIIINKLDQVLENQKLLYQELRKINTNVEQLCGSVERIESSVNQIRKNTQISAWCNMVTAVNTSVIRRIQEEYYKFYR